MIDTDTIHLDMAERLFQRHVTPALLAASERGEWPAALWSSVTDAALHRAFLPEEAGGVGLAITAALALLRVGGAHALPLPLAETMLAGWLLASAGLEVPDAPLTVTTDPLLTLLRAENGWHLSGRAAAVAWARHAAAVAVLADGHVALLTPDKWAVTPGENIAREPRDTLQIDVLLPTSSVAPSAIARPQFRAVGAAMRSLMISGALAAITAMTVQYAGERIQFGRPIGRFQAVQHNLAILASQTAAATAAADMAAEAVANGICLPAIAAAKSRAGEAAGIGAAIAHQMHGALGFTYEHRLHFFTKRLWAWRDEYGSEAEWNLLLGRHLAACGPNRLWAQITAI